MKELVASIFPVTPHAQRLSRDGRLRRGRPRSRTPWRISSSSCGVGRDIATPELVDELLVAVDGLAAMIPAALDGDDRRADADLLEQRLRALATTGVRPVEPESQQAEALNGEPIAAAAGPRGPC